VSSYDDSAFDEKRPGVRSGRHPLSTGYLVTGIVFVGIAASWALQASDVIGDDGSRWVLPLVLIIAGVAGLAASLLRSAVPGRRSARAEELPCSDEPAPDLLADDDQGTDPLAR